MYEKLLREGIQDALIRHGISPIGAIVPHLNRQGNGYYWIKHNGSGEQAESLAQDLGGKVETVEAGGQWGNWFEVSANVTDGIFCQEGNTLQ